MFSMNVSPKGKVRSEPRPKRPVKTIGIIGSRRRTSQTDYQKLVAAFDKVYQYGDRLVSGGCPQGGDAFAELIARRAGLTITVHHADWTRFGRSAGFERNTRIAQDADIILALVAADRTGGTEDTIKKAEALGKEIVCV